MSQPIGAKRKMKKKSTKSKYTSDDECKDRDVKERLVKERIFWVFLEPPELVHLVFLLSDLWEPGTRETRKDEIEAGDYVPLCTEFPKTNTSDCLLLYKGPKKEAEKKYKTALKLLENGIEPTVARLMSEETQNINIAPLKKEWKKVAPKITLGKPFKMPYDNRSEVASTDHELIRDTPLKVKCQKSLTQTPVDETDLEKEIVATRSFSEPIADSTCSQFKKFLVEHEKRMFALQKSLENFLTQTSKQTRERKAALTRKVAMTSETFRVLKRGFEPKNDPDSIQPSIEFNGVNLLKLHASDSPHQFGRNLSQAMFGVNYLTDFVISPRRRGSREPISKDALSIFKKTVSIKYPKTPILAYEEARKGGNQGGLDNRQRPADPDDQPGETQTEVEIDD